MILSSIDRGSRMKVGSVIRLRSAPGRSCDMICESTRSGENDELTENRHRSVPMD